MSAENNTIPNIDSLLYSFTEFLTGEADEERVERIKVWALYNYMLKTMPPLVQHWTNEHPEEKKQLRELFEQVKQWNEAKKQKDSN
ncbi:DUF2573 family protein [Aneurinibacillus sp. BA2021]|nr:DUF2573 family protein [Aneurinibacillus sp. BA2021]